MWRADPRGRLPAAPLAAAIGDTAIEKGTEPAKLFGSKSQRAAWGRLARAAERQDGTVRADVAARGWPAWRRVGGSAGT